MNAESGTSETAYRIRAAVRVVFSSAVWLIIGIQVVSQLALGFDTAPGAEPESEPELWRSLVFFASFALVLYLLAGGFRAFTVGRDRVTISEAFVRAKEVFADFLWLMVKAILLFALLLILVLNLVAFVAGLEYQKLVQMIPELIGPITHAISLALVYWLPIVFVTGTFALFKTLSVALEIARRRLPLIGYPAFLILVPAMVSWLLPEGAPLLLVLCVIAAGNLMSWIAYVYCAEYVIRDREAVMALLAGDGSGAH